MLSVTVGSLTHGGADPLPTCYNTLTTQPTNAIRSPLPNPLQRLRVALSVVPHTGRGRAYGRLLSLLRFTLSHRTVLPSATGTMTTGILVLIAYALGAGQILLLQRIRRR